MKINDETLIAAILASGSYNKAAQQLKISPSSITNRLKKPQFAEKLNDAKAAYLNQAVQELRQELSNSVKVLAAVRDDEEAPQSVRVQAADTILRHASKYIEIVDIAAEIQKLKEQSNV